MINTTQRLEQIISEYGDILRKVDESLYRAKPHPRKWSKVEILGHLVDSAENNIRRFIVAQYEESPAIVYRQDDWVRINNYQDIPVNELINLWVLLNKRICYILLNTSAAYMERTCMTEELQTIGWLADDYIRHLLHHLHQITDNEPVSYP